MKKLAILFLLATVFVSFNFAQVWVKGGLQFKNMLEGKTVDWEKQSVKEPKATPVLYTQIGATGKTELGPGSIGAEVQLGYQIAFEEETEAYGPNGDVYLKGFYELAVGPGTLDFGISAWEDVGKGFGDLHFNVGYSGLAAGPATLGFGLEYDFRTGGKDDKLKNAVFGDDKKSGEKLPDALDFKLTADFAFGLGIEYHFNYALAADSKGNLAQDENYIAEIAKLDVSYKLLEDALKVGFVLDGTGGWNLTDDEQAFFGGDGTLGLGLKPYGEYVISEKAKVGLEIPITGINADSDADIDVDISPKIWVKYTF
jgi:hypothetical protein